MTWVDSEPRGRKISLSSRWMPASFAANTPATLARITQRITKADNLTVWCVRVRAISLPGSDVHGHGAIFQIGRSPQPGPSELECQDCRTRTHRFRVTAWGDGRI